MTSYQRLTYLLIARDPVHIGAGGYRLGRVDNSIVREPGTGVPKIPGSSLHGAIRTYAAREYENLDAAGQKHDKVENPKEDPVCYTFGYLTAPAAGEDQRDAGGFAGVANIFDAQVLLFPVRSAGGPLWVTTRSALAGVDITVGSVPNEWPRDTVLPTGDLGSHVNLGWLNLKTGDKVTLNGWPKGWNKPEWDAVKNSVVVVQEGLFSHVVNSNLEVRTSVSIDPRTGAAASGALFTYEALPRATFLTFDVIIDDYRGKFPKKTATKKNNPLPNNKGWDSAKVVVEAGLRAIEWLGIGGMGTRGFGRLGLVGEAKANPPA